MVASSSKTKLVWKVVYDTSGVNNGPNDDNNNNVAVCGDSNTSASANDALFAERNLVSVSDLLGIFKNGGFPGSKMHGQGGSFYVVRKEKGKSLAKITKNGHVTIFGKSSEESATILNEMEATIKAGNCVCKIVTPNQQEDTAPAMYNGEFPFTLSLNRLRDVINDCDDCGGNQQKLFAFIDDAQVTCVQIHLSLDENKKEGTLRIFASGKVTGMGIKNVTKLQNVLERVCQMMSCSYDAVVKNVKDGSESSKSKGQQGSGRGSGNRGKKRKVYNQKTCCQMIASMTFLLIKIAILPSK